ncbi:hypothetical protein HYT55_01740 [Candidatus Woesearchaeota archaeon]|nr:hypothetical protein [Candidatus Woesearchaeota archaeon]
MKRMKPMKPSTPRNMKQKKNFKTASVKSTTPLAKDSLYVRLAVIVGILVLIILGGLLYRFASIGKALEAPSVQVLDLDLQESEQINVEGVPSLQIKVTPSSSKSSGEFSLALTPNEDGSVSYVLEDFQGVIQAQELLTEQNGGGDIYLPNDELADLKVSYVAPYLKIVNLNFVPPEKVQISVFDEKGDEVSSPFLFLSGGKAHFIFNATSSAAPILSAAWENGVSLGADVFKVVSSAESVLFTIATLDWGQDKEGAYPFIVRGQVGAESTTKRYVLSVGGILYDLTQDDLPSVSIKQVDINTIAVTYDFPETTNPQPFSLPCGKATLVDGTLSDDLEAKIDVISSYSGGVEQWKKDVPSNFNELESNKGYFLERRTSEGKVGFTIQCTSSNGILPPDVTPVFSLPNLKKGWNLIGVSGYEPVPVEKLSASLPPYTTIANLYSITTQKVDVITPVTKLEPGRAYWVKVQ